ncbi:MAG: acetyl-CoA acetyltransferase [Actinomycetes bacterium]
MPATHSSLDPRTPVIIGCGQVLNRVDQGAEPCEPAALMVQALLAAESDSGASGVLAEAQVVAAVPTLSWRYSDPAAVVRGRIGCSTAQTWSATVGGNTPQSMLNRLCSFIAAGDLDLAVLCGGEAGKSRSAAKKAGIELDWARQDADLAPDWMDESPFLMGHPSEAARGILMPLQVYPLFENALWQDSGLNIEEHLETVGQIWAGFSQVAEQNPYAWNRISYTAEQITTPTAENRMIGYPYTKRMVSNPDVDMASGLILCSVERARALGVPTDRWVFVHAGTDAKDRNLTERNNFYSSPAMSVAGNRVLELAQLQIDKVAHLDLYSCYPSAVQLALRELSISADRQLTVYGGLSFAGGPWNNPVGHAICSMVQVLREDAGSIGLVTANGGHVDKHAFGVYSTNPPKAGFRWERPQAEVDDRGGRTAVADFQGEAKIETWTVMHDRDGLPTRGHAACLTPDGGRTWGVSSQTEIMHAMSTEELLGRQVRIGPEGELQFV